MLCWLLPFYNCRKVIDGGDVRVVCVNGETKILKSYVDWADNATSNEHIWVHAGSVSEACYVGEQECSRFGPSFLCSACKITIHSGCVSILTDKIKFLCRQTFKDLTVGNQRQLKEIKDQTIIFHHWVHKKIHNGRCKHCTKAFTNSMVPFSSKEVQAITCSWCKVSYHNAENCFTLSALTEQCTLGLHRESIVPPTWIVKIMTNVPSESKTVIQKPFYLVSPILMPEIPEVGTKPVLVFVNPKSGGSQGAKMMQKFTWLLNPRQVCDLTRQGGPGPTLKVFQNLRNLRIITVGGDGTASWILSSLDELGIANQVPVAVLPLGTGNDLARALGWGGYATDPAAKILAQVREGHIVMLDRWNITVEPNNACLDSSNELISTCYDIETNCDNTIPMNVINNYFSLGVDAYIALQFHLARLADPARFGSRVRNRMYYGQVGGKDLLQRKWKDLSNYVTLECDGQDLTPRLKEFKVHSVLFLNIPSYGGGTKPWSTANTKFEKPKTDDGLIEVIGLTTFQLPLLQAGGHGRCLAQCRSARIVTTRTIPMQVDGEPCKLLPSIISISFRNRVCMLSRSKS